ncbi:hypothetical protein Ciccas_012749 [Cichlidogyrus casuarinus]|uniref:Uncharacterized protein n=1 Tax=Cichlidogyrus casuarinus TaxID=1844966 RepID=A0ABD2PMJ5_9PLAT
MVQASGMPPSTAYIRTKSSAVFTEFDDQENYPKPAYIYRENQAPRFGQVIKRVGSNTFRDDHGRLVHESDIRYRVQDYDDEPEDAVEEPPEDAVEGPPGDAVRPDDDDLPMALRRERRTIVLPARYRS